jgi:ketosteroid isomerase-like protein
LQTLETTRRLSEIDRELIGTLLQAIFVRRAAGDIEGMLALMAPDVVCFPDKTWGYAFYPRRIVGKEAMREALRQRHINYVIVDMEVHRTLIDGDQAVVHRTTTLQERGSGVTFTFDSVAFFRFRDGLITELSDLPDGCALEVVRNFPY